MAQYVPTAEQMATLGNKMWRLSHIFRCRQEGTGRPIPFRLRPEQEMLARHFIDMPTTPAYIIKSRRLGISTFVDTNMVDDLIGAKAGYRGLIIDQTQRDATKKMTEIVRFSYDNLPPEIRNAFVFDTRNDSEFKIHHRTLGSEATASTIEAGTRARGGDTSFLHVSEMGPIAAMDPARAREIRTGALPAVRQGLYVIETTWYGGKSGELWDLVKPVMDGNPNAKGIIYFFPWHSDPKAISITGMVTNEIEDYFLELAAKTGKTFSQEQKKWYAAVKIQQGMWVRREFPSCVCSETYVSTLKGLYKIKDVEVDGKEVLAKYDQGEKPTFTFTTKWGYSVTCTDDHKLLTPEGFREAKELKCGDTLFMRKPTFSTEVYVAKYKPNPLAVAHIEITEDFALFLGFFMGDGCFYKSATSISCTRIDRDVVDEVKRLVVKFIGSPSERIIGDKDGCIEVRANNIDMVKPFMALGIIRKNNSGQGMYKRKIGVPDCIMRSPRNVISAFLRGLFEADGFCAKNGKLVKIFCKHDQFIRDIQWLLLGFGISANVMSHDKVRGKYKYTGWEMSINRDAARVFWANIGFVSKRKMGRLKLGETVARKTQPWNVFEWRDEITKIVPAGVRHVYDITTATHEFIAGGIVVHNCLEEALAVPMEGSIYGELIDALREKKRIHDFVADADFPAFTFSDLGLSDYGCMWLLQFVGRDILALDYYSAEGQNAAHFANIAFAWEKKHGVTIKSHFVPHDAAKRSQGTGKPYTSDMIDAGIRGKDIKTVPRTPDVWIGINEGKTLLPRFFFHSTNCGRQFKRPGAGDKMIPSGLECLEYYHKKVVDTNGMIYEDPVHDIYSNGSDALRTFFEAARSGLIEGGSSAARDHRAKPNVLRGASPDSYGQRPKKHVNVIR